MMIPPLQAQGRLPAKKVAPEHETRRKDIIANLTKSKPETVTTLGMEIFRSRNLSDIRNQLERKSITCALHGGSLPIHLPISIQLLDLELRYAYHLARLTNDKPRLLTIPGETGDIIRHCWMDGLPAILSESPTPVWGQDDRDLLEAVTYIEDLETRAMRGGILL